MSLQPTRASALAPAFLVICAGCIPTFQPARIDPGFHLDAAVTTLSDQGRTQNYLLSISPSYAWGDRFELGLPVGAFVSGERPTPLLMPYGRLALLDSGSMDHLSLGFQTIFVMPSNVTLRYSRNLGAWEPQVSGSWVFAGELGDDGRSSTIQDPNRSILAGSIGATFKKPMRPAVEIGVVRFHQDASYPARGRTTFYDVFVGLRIGLVK
jgi:hypothetical protein